MLNLKQLFTYNPPTAQHQLRYEQLHNAARQFAEKIQELTPECADQTTAFRKVREALAVAKDAVGTH